jgi:hypothetical protein
MCQFIKVEICGAQLSVSYVAYLLCLCAFFAIYLRTINQFLKLVYLTYVNNSQNTFYHDKKYFV